MYSNKLFFMYYNQTLLTITHSRQSKDQNTLLILAFHTLKKKRFCYPESLIISVRYFSLLYTISLIKIEPLFIEHTSFYLFIFAMNYRLNHTEILISNHYTLITTISIQLNVSAHLLYHYLKTLLTMNLIFRKSLKNSF